MIAPVYAQVGDTVTLQGYADDYGNHIVAMEFSLDGGQTWAAHDTSESDPGRSIHWTFSYTFDEPGAYSFMARAVTEDGRRTPIAASTTIHVS